MNRALLALFFAASTFAQESAPATRPSARDLFNKAAAAQVAGGKPVAIKDFQVELEVTVHETDPKTKERNRRSANVIQYYRDRGEKRPLFRRELNDKLQGTRTRQGYDGYSYWQQLGDSPARDLRGRESQDERKRIISEMNRAKDYLRFLFLANLDGPDVKLTHAGARKIEAGRDNRNVQVILRETPKEPPIELFIGESEGRSVLYGFSRKMESGKTELIAFAIHRVVKSGDVTALVPLVAQYREDGILTFEFGIRDETFVKFNTNIDDRMFAIPPK